MEREKTGFHTTPYYPYLTITNTYEGETKNKLSHYNVVLLYIDCNRIAKELSNFLGFYKKIEMKYKIKMVLCYGTA